MIKTYQEFFGFTCVILGAFAGLLLAMPMVLRSETSFAPLFLVLGMFLGGVIGYRRRKSRVFFYVCLIVILMLSVLLVRN
jgi:hypothetical protein